MAAEERAVIVAAGSSSRTIALTSLALLAGGCGEEDKVVNKAAIKPMIGAIMHSRREEVRRLAERKIGLEERDPASGATPILVAAETDQWDSVEVLIDNGADIWAHDRFGLTAARFVLTDRILKGSVEDDARLRVLATMKARGFPIPAPDADEVLELSRRGEWPPKGAR